MPRAISLIIPIAALALAIYLSADAIKGASDVALTLRDLFFPTAKPAVVAVSSPAPANPAPVSPAPLSGFPAKFRNSLMVMDGGSPRMLDTATLAGVKYWAFYYSASWCPPCRAFTPDLVSFYRDFKPGHPDFELIFVNDDQSEDDMLAYMRNDAMPWPAVWFNDINDPALDAKRYCGEGIPCLVLVDGDGQVISDTYVNGQYTDPHHVIDDMRTMVK
jgi:nucleoredoxin